MDSNQALIEAQRIATFGTLAAAFIGGFIGFLGSWIANMSSAKAERKKLLLQLGFEMGIKQYEKAYELATKQSRKIAPPYIYVHHNVKVLELLATES
ncbi:MAG TPA: hypothetical protein VLT51_11210 [Anaerolineales bacterium]|nr:hypothetical protein [Anaerolineales bacterium]